MDWRPFHKYLRNSERTEVWNPRVGEGWHRVIYAALRKIDIRLGDENYGFKIEQIKEKFGTLRFYISIAVDAPETLVKAVRKFAHEAEMATHHICEKCGAHGYTEPWNGAWLRTLCVAHAREVRMGTPLPKYPAWEAITLGDDMRLVDAVGVQLDASGVLELARALFADLDRVALKKKAVSPPARFSKQERDLMNEITDLQAYWFLAGGNDEIDQIVAERRAAGLPVARHS